MKTKIKTMAREKNRWRFRSGALIVGVFLWFFPLVVGAQSADDHDGDEVPDAAEMQTYHTDPGNADSDGDGYADGVEIAQGFSPRHGESRRLVEADSDGDELNDAWEIAIGTHLDNPDSDGDGYLDGTEVAAGYDPLTPGAVRIEKLVRVNLADQRLNYSFDGKILEEFPISGGLPAWPTPVGNFTVLHKVPVKHYQGRGFDYPNTKWNLHFATRKYNYYIHGAYWHNDFGKPKSHGCVNVGYDQMERLYWFSQIGTTVQVE